MDFHDFFSGRDLRKQPLIGVHFEQKTTPDLLWCVASVIQSFDSDRQRDFTDTDIKGSALFTTLMKDYFSKAPQDTAPREYDKLSRYQLHVLVYAGVLEEIGTSPRRFRVVHSDVIERLAQNDFTAAQFLTEYTDKLVKDNGLWPTFEQYARAPNHDHYEQFKEAYWQWARVHTNIRGVSRHHTYRVANKIFNVLCYKYKVPGEQAARIVPGPCPYSFLIYKRKNFRDEDKPAGLSRQDYQQQIVADINSNGYTDALMKKAKDAVKSRHGNDSEITDSAWGYAHERVVEAHHILPVHSYQQFSLTKENLISLTPDQHRSFAHNGSYRTINRQYQAVCLRKKLDSIVNSLETHEDFYDYPTFIAIVNTCYGLELRETTSPAALTQLLDQKIIELEATI